MPYGSPISANQNWKLGAFNIRFEGSQSELDWPAAVQIVDGKLLREKQSKNRFHGI